MFTASFSLQSTSSDLGDSPSSRARSIQDIAANISDFAGNWDAVWENILLRASLKEVLLEYYAIEKDDEFLEAEFVIKCNDKMHLLISEVREKLGAIDNNEVIKEFRDWIEGEISMRKTRNKLLDVMD